MISPKELKLKAEKWWKEVLQSTIIGYNFFPREIPQIGASKQEDLISDFVSLSKQIEMLNKESKDSKGFGYRLQWEERNFRTIGKNRFIKSVYFECLDDYLKFLGKEKDFRLFQKSVELLLLNFPSLKDWIIQNPIKVISYSDIWQDLLKVLKYFKSGHISDQYYIRELPIAVHTKFIEEYKPILYELLNAVLSPLLIRSEYVGIKDFEKRFGIKFNEALVRIRILDKELADIKFSGLTDLSITESEFNNLNLNIERIFVFENKTNYSNIMNFLTLPGLSKSIALFGSGFKVGLLKNASWLNNKQIFYWGDLDIQGFQILSQLRSYFPHVQSFLMDRETLHIFKNEAVKGLETAIGEPKYLTSEELELYRYLLKENLRLEQEKILHEYVMKTMEDLFEE